MTIPRFALSENFGDLDRFRLITHSLPFHIENLEPEDPYLSSSTPLIGFSLKDHGRGTDVLNCFISGLGLVPFENISDSRIELRPDSELTETRTRLNCTLPAGKDDVSEVNLWRWFGVLFTLPEQLPQISLQE